MTANRVGGSLAIASAVVIGSATLFPTPGASTIPHFCLVCGQLGGVDAVLNVALFLPLGIGLGLRKTGFLRALILIAGSTALVELLQLTVITGRSATIGDIAMNTIGGVLGYLAGTRWRALVLPDGRLRRALMTTALVAFIGMMTLTGWSLQPSPTRATFFGHFTRPYGSEPAFPGTVRSASIGPCVVTNVSEDDYPCIHAALLRGDTMSVDVLARGMTVRPAAIVRVVDERQNDIAILGGDRDRAIFSVRTRAGAMKLRAYRFALDSVFDSRSTRDVHLSGVFTPASSTMLAEGPGLQRRVDLRLGPASGWRLLLPLQYYDDGSLVAPLLGAGWMALLLFPVGYWSVETRVRPARPELALLILGLAGGLLACPFVFRTAAPSIGDVAGAVAGIVAGAWARSRVARVAFRQSSSS